MKVRTVYLAGGISGLGDNECNGWRAEAKALLPREIDVLDPMSRDYRGKEGENVKAIVEGDLADIQSCQVIIAYCPRPSWGTAMEIHYAATADGYRRTVAVVPAGVAVSPWLRYHTDAVVPTLEAAVEQVKEWSA